ncbi:MAG: hypothetical protein EB015_19535, partial [Methylocystaceae bacterium]|nr:hypothetical protein [Methylocystaceae bacterium]
MSFVGAATRWWNDRGQCRKDKNDIERSIAWLQENIGPKTALLAIDNNLVAQLVSKRRATGVSNGTVNRTVTEPLRAIIK